jgi:ankyrin repeat protein
MTALNWACRKGHFGVSKLLLKNRANVDIPNRSNETPILSAIKNNHHDICRLLIDYNCDITIRSHKDGRTVQYYIDKNKELLDYYNFNTRWMRRKYFMIVLVENGYMPSKNSTLLEYKPKKYDNVFGSVDLCRRIMSFV